MDRSKQAFPHEAYQDTDAHGYPTLRMPGMTLREYAAVAAMKAILSNGEMIDSGDAAKWVVNTAVSHADALLARLEEANNAD